MVSITLRVLSRPDVEHLSKIYQSLGMDYDERVLPSIGNEVLKSIVAQFDAAELITQREVVCSTGGREFPLALISIFVGLVKDSRRSSATRWRIQLEARRRFDYTFNFWKGGAYCYFAARDADRSLGIHPGCRSQTNRSAGYVYRIQRTNVILITYRC